MVGFTTLLALLFITLKLIGQIDWSWWWVLSPLWIPFVIGIAIFVVVLGFIHKETLVGNLLSRLSDCELEEHVRRLVDGVGIVRMARALRVVGEATAYTPGSPVPPISFLAGWATVFQTLAYEFEETAQAHVKNGLIG